jgi:putative membrane protein
MLICAGITVVSRIFANKITTLIVVAALLVTGIDVLIEQVAPKLDFGLILRLDMIYKNYLEFSW